MGKIMQFYSIAAMRNVLFFSRVAFICNICFLLVWLIRIYPEFADSALGATIIILGYLLAIGLNVIMNFITAVLMLSGKEVMAVVPKWLLIGNLIFLIAQIIFLLR